MCFESSLSELLSSKSREYRVGLWRYRREGVASSFSKHKGSVQAQSSAQRHFTLLLQGISPALPSHPRSWKGPILHSRNAFCVFWSMKEVRVLLATQVLPAGRRLSGHRLEVREQRLPRCSECENGFDFLKSLCCRDPEKPVAFRGLCRMAILGGRGP